MRGKKPKERKNYVLRMGDGTLVGVSREVYLEWYQSRRRERYQREKDHRHGVCSLDELGEIGCYSGMTLNMGEGSEEIVLRNICRNNVRATLGRLPDSDARLVGLLYFEEVTVTAAAQIYGCSRKTIQNRRKRILGELRQMLLGQGIRGGFF